VLIGHSGPVNRVAVSPDGKWIASASGKDVRLWRMPDLSKPPFHTLPYPELMAKLHALTNLRVVEDPSSATGYKIEVGPFPGWKDVPTWYTFAACWVPRAACRLLGAARREPHAACRVALRPCDPRRSHFVPPRC
jgi:hypothetical protein